MATTATRDRLRTLIDVLVDSLGEPARGDELARRAYLSRFHFDRLVAAGLGEAPESSAGGCSSSAPPTSSPAVTGARGGARRRLLLGRGLRPGFPSGLRRLPQPLPRRFPSTGAERRPLPPARRAAHSRRYRKEHSHGSDRPHDRARPLAHEPAARRRGRASAGGARPARARHRPSRSTPGSRTATRRSARCSTASSTRRRSGRRPSPGATSPSAAEPRSRSCASGTSTPRRSSRPPSAASATATCGTRRSSTRLCDPPQTFTFGGMVAHVLTWSAHRRLMIAGALRNFGADIGSPDPLEWERRAA